MKYLILTTAFVLMLSASSYAKENTNLGPNECKMNDIYDGWVRYKTAIRKPISSEEFVKNWVSSNKCNTKLIIPTIKVIRDAGKE